MKLIDIYCVSDQGTREDNEDSAFYWAGRKNGRDIGVLAVADGVGGSQKGEVASNIAIIALKKWLHHFLGEETEENQKDNILFKLNQLVVGIDASIQRYGAQHHIVLGITFTLLFFWEGKVYLAHSGDSKACFVMEEVQQLTQSHKVFNELDNREYLTSCLGRLKHFDVQLEALPLQCGFYIVGSDGVFNRLEDVFLLKKLSEGNRLEMTATQIIKMIRQQGETDNATMILALVEI
ncbi:PP2C family protein-serine/threonine phosphatase [Eubacterium aggregans]|uniref:PP2C family protein-serine/threonine phosphatase n=1 Tax=Eubacterium aggregans TaxID=81409 RepID=UPI003F3E00E9